MIGDNIKRIRMARNMMQWELGEMIGKSQKTVSSWERGDRYPQSKDVEKLAKALGVAPAEIIGHSELHDNEFEYIVTSDDMSPEIVHGDTLTVNSKIQPSDGDLVIVQDDKQNQLVRRLYRIGKYLSLMALNPAIKPIQAEPDNITIQGTVTELRRKI